MISQSNKAGLRNPWVLGMLALIMVVLAVNITFVWFTMKEGRVAWINIQLVRCQLVVADLRAALAFRVKRLAQSRRTFLGSVGFAKRNLLRCSQN